MQPVLLPCPAASIVRCGRSFSCRPYRFFMSSRGLLLLIRDDLIFFRLVIRKFRYSLRRASSRVQRESALWRVLLRLLTARVSGGTPRLRFPALAKVSTPWCRIFSAASILCSKIIVAGSCWCGTTRRHALQPVHLFRRGFCRGFSFCAGRFLVALYGWFLRLKLVRWVVLLGSGTAILVPGQKFAQGRFR